MLVVFILSGILYYTLVRYVLIHELDEALSDYKHKIEAYVKTNGQLPDKCFLDETLIDYYTINQKEPKQYYLIQRYDVNENTTHKYRQLQYSLKIGSQYYRVTVAKELEGTKMLTRTILLTTLGLILLIIAITVLINTVLLKRLWRPFYKTMDKLEDFKIGSDEHVSFGETDIDEFSLLNRNLEQTIQRAKDDYKTLKEFTENAAHEMQTPVSIIRSKLDLIIQDEGLSEKQTNAIASAYSGVKRLNKLNQSLLLLAKIENQQFDERSDIRLDEKILTKMEQFKEIWNTMELTIYTDLQATNIVANDALMDVLLNNVFSNAANHNTGGGKISIHLANGILTIANSGAPVSMVADAMFKRFNKGDQSSRSNGLGLSIVKEACVQSEILLRYYFKDHLHYFEFDCEKILKA
jgi:signal transduction histidine kinase